MSYAIGAFDAGRLIGVANYVVAKDDPHAAEVAIAVAHDDHRAGVGTALFKQLGQIAASHGIRCFTADVLAENNLMRQVVRDIGWPRKRLTDDAGFFASKSNCRTPHENRCSAEQCPALALCARPRGQTRSGIDTHIPAAIGLDEKWRNIGDTSCAESAISQTSPGLSVFSMPSMQVWIGSTEHGNRHSLARRCWSVTSTG
jgi:Acetyltransferase (GNAT) family